MFPSTDPGLKLDGAMEVEELPAQPKIVLTQNKMGFMIQTADEYIQAFVAHVQRSPKPFHVADLGVAFGYTSKLLLDAGANVIANDLAESHLIALYDSVDEDGRNRLMLLPGNALDLVIPSASLEGILACRWIQFLSGDELRKVLLKFYGWLKPGGRLCLTTVSIYIGIHRNAMDKYVSRKEAGEEWPGYVEQKDLRSERRAHLPEHYMVYDVDILEREMKLAGFIVEKIGYIDRPDYPEDAKNGGREGLGVIASKPSNIY